ncbi:MAG: DUF2935 domain-containing protein [Solirubrobacterales bacterium]
MYCYTYVNQYNCVFNEIQLWSHISSDHPIFFKTVASLSKIELPEAVEDKLLNIHNGFMKIYKQSIYMKKNHLSSGVKNLLKEFINLDTYVLSFYPQLIEYGKGNDAWSELVNHIISEQKFMYELICDLIKQI